MNGLVGWFDLWEGPDRTWHAVVRLAGTRTPQVGVGTTTETLNAFVMMLGTSYRQPLDSGLMQFRMTMQQRGVEVLVTGRDERRKVASGQLGLVGWNDAAP